MRGKAPGVSRPGLWKGITPAYAGKRRDVVKCWAALGDHPRVCGEKLTFKQLYVLMMGSPPRMRGKGGHLLAAQVSFGITPAYAGKRTQTMGKPSPGWDHPRVCGEKSQAWPSRPQAAGSPPRMRGKGTGRKRSCLLCRITPAYAGKSCCQDLQPARRRDHPRVCGEKDTAGSLDAVRVGSPPRMRGKAHDLFRQATKMGITPAYAGKRLKRSHSIGHFSCILCLFHSVLHRASASGGSRAGPCAPPCLTAQNAVPV